MGVLVTVVAGVVMVVMYALGRKKSASRVHLHAGIQHMRAIGQLSVFKVITKEIATETDHTWGDFGARYLSWVLSSKKMAMIFEFEIDFRYDLRRPDFEIIGADNDAYIVKMPPCVHEVHIRDIRFYDEQRARFMPWLLPDLLNGFLSGGFSEADKNRLVAAAKEHAARQAVELIGNLQSEVQNSAKATLSSIGKAFGAQNMAFEFMPQGKIELAIGMAGPLAA
jgi:hypothetical protein